MQEKQFLQAIYLGFVEQDLVEVTSPGSLKKVVSTMDLMHRTNETNK